MPGTVSPLSTTDGGLLSDPKKITVVSAVTPAIDNFISEKQPLSKVTQIEINCYSTRYYFYN
jgi:hypothetical protein